MLKKLLLLIFLCFALIKGFTQDHFSMSELIPLDTNYLVGLHAAGRINSNTITDKFLLGFLDGRKISETDKKNILDRAGDQNRFGYETKSGLFFAKRGIRLFNKNLANSTFFFQVRDRQFLNANFSKDLLKLALNGNRQFAGQTVDLGDFELNFARYQQIQLGWAISDTVSSYGIGMSYINGERYLELKSSSLSFATSELGDVAEIAIDLEAYQSDTNQQNFLNNNGHGFSVDLFYERLFTLKMKNESLKGKFSLDIQDIGMITWSDQTVFYDIDSNYTYTGTQIDDLFNLGDTVINFVTPDSIYDALTTRSRKESKTSVLPANIHGRVTIQNNTWEGTLGIIYKINANYTPYIYTRALRKFSSRIEAGGSFGYGGYGKLSYGIEGYFDLKICHLGIGSKHLEGITFPNSSGGNQFYLTIKKTF